MELIIKSMLDSDQSLATFAVAIIVLFAMHVLTNMIKFLWGIFTKKKESDDKEFRKLKLDMNRYYNGLRTLAGSRWQEVRQSMDEEEE